MSRLSNLAANGARLTAVQQSIRALRGEEELIQERPDSYKYPVLTLPNEIVSEIFVHFLPVYPLCPPLTGLLSPTTLTHICHHWRAIALATPSLWRAISISREQHSIEAVTLILDSWLLRSGGCPVSIQMESSTSLPNIELLAQQDRIMEVISQCSARWEYIKVSIHLSNLRHIADSLPLLRDIHLDVEFIFFGTPSLPMTFRDAPLLRSVTLTDFTEPVDGFGFLPWSQLTSFILLGTTPGECGLVLAQTTNLVHCELVIFSEEDSYPDIKLAHLETLRLIALDATEDPVTRYLESFIVPALRTLQVPDDYLGSNPIQGLESFMSKSGCQLQEVCISGPRHIPRDAYHRAFPSISKFSFNQTFEEWSGEAFVDEESDTESA